MPHHSGFREQKGGGRVDEAEKDIGILIGKVI